MLTYRLIFTDASGQTSGGSTTLSAETDADALLLAAHTATSEAGSEVWQGSRMVCRLPPGPTAAIWPSSTAAQSERY